MVSEAELLEVFRLGECAADAEIVRIVGDRLAAEWSTAWRFRDMDALMERSLAVQVSPETLQWAGLASQTLVRWMDAVDHHFQLLELLPETGDRTAQAVTRSNLGALYDELGQTQVALGIQRSIGDRVNEPTTLNNIGGLHHSREHLQPALTYYEEALLIRRAVGERAGEAATLNNIGRIHDGKGDRERALALYEEALAILRDIGDRPSESVTRFNIALVHRADGRLTDAGRELELVVELDREVQHPDLETDMATLEHVRAELAALDGTDP